MATKSGGMLNAICAKLRKTNNQPSSPLNKISADGEDNKISADVEDNKISSDEEDNKILADGEGVKLTVKTLINDAETDKENNNEPLLNDHNDVREEDEVEGDLAQRRIIPSQLIVSEGRKNRRKNLKPQNIAQIQEKEIAEDIVDELEEYEINNEGVDFEAMYAAEEEKDEDEEEGEADEDGGFALDLSAQETPYKSDRDITFNSGTLSDNANDSYYLDDSGVLDLSVTKSNVAAEDDSISSYANQSNHGNGDDDVSMDTDDDDEDIQVSNKTAVSDTAQFRSYDSVDRKVAPTHVESTTDATVLKDYAQNTVSELLSIYGFGDEAESVTQSVPLLNFSSGKILERHGLPAPLPSNVPKMAHKSHIANLANSALAGYLLQNGSHSVPQTPPTSAFSSNHTPTSSCSSNASSTSGTPTGIPSTQQGAEAYAKFMDSMAKISSMPHGMYNHNYLKTQVYPTMTFDLLI